MNNVQKTIEFVGDGIPYYLQFYIAYTAYTVHFYTGYTAQTAFTAKTTVIFTVFYIFIALWHYRYMTQSKMFTNFCVTVMK